MTAALICFTGLHQREVGSPANTIEICSIHLIVQPFRIDYELAKLMQSTSTVQYKHSSTEP